MTRTPLTAIGLAAVLALGSTGTALAAEAWPTRPLQLIVGDAPGGSIDTVARLVSEGVAARLGQPVVVENRPGASGMIASSQVMRAKPDGYTALFSVTGLVMNPILFPQQATYDVQKDFKPVAIATESPMLLVVNDQVKADSLDKLIAEGKANPGKLSYGSIGQGSPTHIYSAIFGRDADMDWLHVPYQGGGPVMQALLGNQVQAAFLTYGITRPHIESGRLRAMAVTGPDRLVSNDRIPTFVESGFPSFKHSGWMGYFMPAGTPDDRVEAFARAVHEAVQEPKLRDQLRQMGLEGDGSGPQALAETVARDKVRWGDWIANLGIPIN